MPLPPRDALEWVPNRREVGLGSQISPRLLVVVDTEEEFDWGKPFDRANTGVDAMAHLGPFQELCDSFGIRPVYVCDYPVVDQANGRELLVQYHKEGRAIIGAHLHPWVSPPHEEEVNAYHSYPGNLEPRLEREKLLRLRDRIETEFGERPTIYKAGRYGFGPNTAQILQELGFEIDLSPCGPHDFRGDGGPDYRGFSSRPYLFGEGLLALPATGAYVGFLGHDSANSLYTWSGAPGLQWARLKGIFSRLGVVDRLSLSPEGYTISDLRKLTDHLRKGGESVFSLTLHSPSLSPGNTSYVRDESQLKDFVERIRQYFTYFTTELGGIPSTPAEVRELLTSAPSQAS